MQKKMKNQNLGASTSRANDVNPKDMISIQNILVHTSLRPGSLPRNKPDNHCAQQTLWEGFVHK